jgi:hypothetical protein
VDRADRSKRTQSRRPLRRAAWLLASCAAPVFVAPSASPAAQPRHEDGVNGRNLVRVETAEGVFEQGRDGAWIEYGRDGQVRSRLEETQRDEWSVYLSDRARGVSLQLDVFRRMVTLFGNGRVLRDLYAIVDARASNGLDLAGRRDDDDWRSGGRSVAGGFYRQEGRPEVMFQYSQGSHCVVQNESQMAAFGGWARVQVVGSMQMRGANTGACLWPNGFYRRSNEPAVYRLHGLEPAILGDLACHVVNPAQMERFGGWGQLRVVPAGADLFRGREPPGECTDR